MNKKKKCDGYALMISIVTLTIMTTGGTMILHMVSQKAFFERKRTDQLHAKMLSEAGVRQAYARIQVNPLIINHAFSDISLNGGTISTVIQRQSAGNGAGNTILRSTGKYNGTEVSSAIALACAGTDDPSEVNPLATTENDPALFLFGNAIFCGKNANMTGASYINLNGGYAHINGTLRMVGSAAFNKNGYVSSSTGISLTGGAKINADAGAPEISIPNSASMSQFITGTSTEKEVPELFIEIDLQPFFEYAKARDVAGSYINNKWNGVITDAYISADEIKNGKFTLNANQTLRPDGGVVWIEGEVRLNGNSIVEGCVISTGDIKICGNMTQINPNGLPSFISQGGDLDLQSGCVAYGMLYAHSGDIRIGGNATVDGGAFICPRGSFTHSGSGKILYANCYPYGPNGEDVTLPNIVDTVMTDVGEIPVPTFMGWAE